jgi:hypothetical protein
VGFGELSFTKRFQFGIFSFTIGLVLLLGVALYWSMGLSGEKGVDQDTEQLVRQELRQVASVEASVGLDSSAWSGPSIVEVDCRDRSERPPFAVPAQHLRLKTKGCEITGLENKSNGFRATIFPLSDRIFSSDYISLQKGENRIVITAMGETEDFFQITFSVLSQ